MKQSLCFCMQRSATGRRRRRHRSSVKICSLLYPTVALWPPPSPLSPSPCVAHTGGWDLTDSTIILLSYETMQSVPKRQSFTSFSVELFCVKQIT